MKEGKKKKKDAAPQDTAEQMKAEEVAVDVEPGEVATAAGGSVTDPFDRRLFAEFPSWPTWFGRWWPDRLLGDVGTMLDHIKVEEYMDGDTLVIRGEIPGVNPEKDIDISIKNGRLSIKAERISKTEDDTDGYRSEFRYGSFSRVVALPEGADVEDVDASYVDGILEVRVPMTAEHEADTKKVMVKRADR
jgi:HSP20 family protein